MSLREETEPTTPPSSSNGAGARGRAAPPAASISRKSLGNQIADHLRQEILLGRLAPGTTVSQQSLCEVYGTSRMPIRDALMKLSNEGLINSSGAISVVAQLTKEDVLDAFDIEAMLHGRAGIRAAQRASDEEIAQLTTIHEAMTDAQSRGDLAPLGDLNWRFHREINKLARSPKLVSALRTVALHVPRTYLTELPDWASRANAEHTAIVDALQRRDGAEVEQLLHDHIRAAGINLTHYLEETGLFDLPKPPS